MELRKEIEKSLKPRNNEVEAVEDHGMIDSVLEIASGNFVEQDVLDLPLLGSRKRVEVDLGRKYTGKPVSRKRYSEEVGMSVESSDEEVDDSDGVSNLQESDDEEDFDASIEGDDSDEDDSAEEDDGEDSNEGSEDFDNDEEKNVSDMEADGNELDDSEDDSVQVFSSIQAAPADIKKGLAVKEQLRCWESLLECRIKLEPALLASNQLFQLDKMSEFISREKETDISNWETALNSLEDLTVSWRKLQDLLGENINEKESSKRGDNSVNVADQPGNDDSNSDNESIRSSEASGKETDDELSQDEDKTIDDSEPPPPKKRKPSQPIDLNTAYSDFSSFRDIQIDKWNEKAKISTGKAAQKDFSAFDQSILKLIESILYDKYRLVKKTQVKRLDYGICGKSAPKEVMSEDVNDENPKDQIKKEVVHDPEIFDDGDFYQKLLRDFIEGKSSDGGISKHERKLMELHRLRIKMKRKIDTRATKGRKLRYVVHQKLLNFMAPVARIYSAESENQLFRSLFGQASIGSN